MKKASLNKRVFKDRVRWEFRIAVHGYGRNVEEALQAAASNLQRQVNYDFSSEDFQAIEDHELVLVDEGDTEK